MTDDGKYAPLRRLMSRFGAQGSAKAFYWAVNDAYHTAESADYDRLHAGMIEALGPVWQRLARHLPESPAKLAVLDVGCGTGLVGKLLNVLCPQRIGELTLLDPCQGMLDQCQAKASSWPFACRLVKGDISAIDGAARYDVITIDSTLHHIVDLAAFCRRVVDLLAAGGALLTAQDPRAEADTDRVYLRRAEGRKGLAGWLKRRLVTPVRDALGLYPPDPPLAVATNRPLLEQGVVRRPMNIRSIYAVTDFHVPGLPGAWGEGLSVEKLRGWLGGLELVDQFTYQYFGVTWSALSAQRKQEERSLWEAGDAHGQLLGTAWRKRG